MKIGIMQPYFLPYIGYWQLIHTVDKYVIFDDVNYIKKGWINRNRILLNGQEYTFTLPLIKVSQNKKINELYLFKGYENKKELLQKIFLSYKHTPYFQDVKELLQDIILFKEDNLCNYIQHSIICISDYLNINTQFILSSKIHKHHSLKGQEKIIDICKILDGDVYINPISGKELYNNDTFKEISIDLYFLRTKDIIYSQYKTKKFISNLSIIDILCNNNNFQLQHMLKQYECIKNQK